MVNFIIKLPSECKFYPKPSLKVAKYHREKKFLDIKPAEAGTGVYIAFFVKKMHF